MGIFLEVVLAEEVVTVGMTSLVGDSDQPLGKESSQVLIFFVPFYLLKFLDAIASL